MPQIAYDPVAGILAKAPTPNALRASAWDAFHEATDEHDLATRLGDLAIPDSVKADLWDLKATGRTTPVSAEDFMTPAPQGSAGRRFLSNAADLLNPITIGKSFMDAAADARPEDAAFGPAAVLAPFLRGTLRGQASEASRAMDAARTGDPSMAVSHGLAAAVPFIGPAAGAARDQMESGDVAGGAGKAFGLAALTALGDPAAAAAKSAIPRLATIGEQIAAKAVPLVPKVLPKVGSVAVDVAGHALGLPIASARAGAKILRWALDAAKDAPAKISTPPQPDLPAGYTPRATAPKPKPARPPADPPQEAPPAPKRAYFLKPVSELQKAGPVRVETPTGSITPGDLPASWQARIGQDVIPTTGADGDAALAALQQEIADSGLSIGEAIVAVSKNKALPTQIRAQLLKALSKAGGR